jgi:hypothetical protein
MEFVSVDGEEVYVRPGNYFVNDKTCGVKNDDTTMEIVPA